MALTHQPVFVQTPQVTPVSFTNSDSANTKKTLVTAGTNATKLVGCTASSTDTSTRIAQLWLNRSSTSYLLASVTIAITAGSDGATAVQDLLASATWPGLPVETTGTQRFLILKSGDILQISLTTQVTAAKEVDIVAQSLDF